MDERFLVLYRGAVDDLPLLLARDYDKAAALAKAVAEHPNPPNHPAVAAVCDLMRRKDVETFHTAAVLRFWNSAPTGIVATFDAGHAPAPTPAELGGEG